MALTGQQVVNDDVRGSLRIGDVLLGGLQGYIDLELAGRSHELMGDRATVNDTGVATAPEKQPVVNTAAAVDTIRNLAWWQIGGLVLAGGLTWALLSGQFR